MLESDPILVLGAPRSGTTYLQSILDRHPRVELTNELRVFTWLHEATKSLPAEIGAEMAKPNPFVQQLEEELPGVVRRHYAERAPDARWWGDKNPHYAADPAVLETVLDCYPNAQFVHIVRDPRAVYSSTLRLWKRLAEDEGLHVPEDDRLRQFVLDNYLQLYRSFDEVQHRIAPNRLCHLRYEELVVDPVGQIRRIYEQLDLAQFDAIQPAIEKHPRKIVNMRLIKIRCHFEEQRHMLAMLHPQLLLLLL